VKIQVNEKIAEALDEKAAAKKREEEFIQTHMKK